MNTTHDPLPPGAFRGKGYWVEQVIRDMREEAHLQHLLHIKRRALHEGRVLRWQWLVMNNLTESHGPT